MSKSNREDCGIVRAKKLVSRRICVRSPTVREGPQANTIPSRETNQVANPAKEIIKAARIILLILFSLTVSQVGFAQSPAKRQASPEIARNARFRSLDGKAIKLEDYRGKVVLLGLWASWCAPCRTSVPVLADLRKQFVDRGVEVVALTLENPQTDEAEVRRFLSYFSDVKYKVGWISRISADKLMAGQDVLPQTFIIKDGVILKSFVGWHATRTIEQLRAALEETVGKAKE